eukprot:2746231-Rhodomonas_salina.3
MLKAVKSVIRQCYGPVSRSLTLRGPFLRYGSIPPVLLTLVAQSVRQYRTSRPAASPAQSNGISHQLLPACYACDPLCWHLTVCVLLAPGQSSAPLYRARFPATMLLHLARLLGAAGVLGFPSALLFWSVARAELGNEGVLHHCEEDMKHAETASMHAGCSPRAKGQLQGRSGPGNFPAVEHTR